eukprot:gene15314-19263_t
MSAEPSPFVPPVPVRVKAVKALPAKVKKSLAVAPVPPIRAPMPAKVPMPPRAPMLAKTPVLSKGAMHTKAPMPAKTPVKSKGPMPIKALAVKASTNTPPLPSLPPCVPLSAAEELKVPAPAKEVTAPDQHHDAGSAPHPAAAPSAAVLIRRKLAAAAAANR